MPKLPYQQLFPDWIYGKVTKFSGAEEPPKEFYVLTVVITSRKTLKFLPLITFRNISEIFKLMRTPINSTVNVILSDMKIQIRVHKFCRIVAPFGHSRMSDPPTKRNGSRQCKILNIITNNLRILRKCCYHNIWVV